MRELIKYEVLFNAKLLKILLTYVQRIMLEKTGLFLAMPSKCYGAVAPRSDLALKIFIGLVVRVIDSIY